MKDPNSKNSEPDISPGLEPLPHETITSRLLAWYRREGRDLPWRKLRDPYAIWVSEVMLQQTQVATVIPYFLAFMNLFPSVEALARAEPDQVMKAWENLGYYRRARNLHQAAGILVDRHQGQMPQDRDALLDLPGIGPYIADAILSIAFGRPLAAVDGNVRRVAARLAGIETLLDVRPGRDLMQNVLDRLLPADHPGDFNQALMDFGSSICLPKTPACGPCFLQDCCLAFKTGKVKEIPRVRPRKTPPCRPAAVAVIRDGQERFLFTRGPEQGLLGGLWKWPGGIFEEGQDLAAALIGKIEEELGLGIRVGPELAQVTHRFTHLQVVVKAFDCGLEPGQVLKETGAWIWAGKKELNALALSNLDRKILKKISP